MPHPHPMRPDPEEHERRLAEADELEREAAEHQDRLDRLAEQASLPAWHPAVHRLARRERARRAGLPDDREAA